MVVRTNIFSLNAHRNMKNTGLEKSRAARSLSSGYRINSAADDAAGLAISETMRAQIRGLEKASRNAQDGISLVQTAEGAMQEIHNKLHRIRELVVQASNDTYATSDAIPGDEPGQYVTIRTTIQREMIQEEINQLMREINSIARRTEFNSMRLLDGSAAWRNVPSMSPFLTPDGLFDFTLPPIAPLSDTSIAPCSGPPQPNSAILIDAAAIAAGSGPGWNFSGGVLTIGNPGPMITTEITSQLSWSDPAVDIGVINTAFGNALTTGGYFYSLSFSEEEAVRWLFSGSETGTAAPLAGNYTFANLTAWLQNNTSAPNFDDIAQRMAQVTDAENVSGFTTPEQLTELFNRQTTDLLADGIMQRINAALLPGSSERTDFLTAQGIGDTVLTDAAQLRAWLNADAGNITALSGTIAANTAIRIDGAIPGLNRIEVAPGTSTNLVLNNVNINATGGPALSLGPANAGASVNLWLEGSNTLRGAAGGHAGIKVAQGNTIVINGTGSLEAVGTGAPNQRSGAGIGGSGIFGSHVDNTAGNITINGGNITARGGGEAAGIGGGRLGGGGTIIINDGNVHAFAGTCAPGAIGAGCGSSAGTVVVNSGRLTLTANSPHNRAVSGTLTLNDGLVEVITGNIGGATTVNGGNLSVNMVFVGADGNAVKNAAGEHQVGQNPFPGTGVNSNGLFRVGVFLFDGDEFRTFSDGGNPMPYVYLTRSGEPPTRILPDSQGRIFLYLPWGYAGDFSVEINGTTYEGTMDGFWRGTHPPGNNHRNILALVSENATSPLPERDHDSAWGIHADHPGGILFVPPPLSAWGTGVRHDSTSGSAFLSTTATAPGTFHFIKVPTGTPAPSIADILNSGNTVDFDPNAPDAHNVELPFPGITGRSYIVHAIFVEEAQGVDEPRQSNRIAVVIPPYAPPGDGGGGGGGGFGMIPLSGGPLWLQLGANSMQGMFVGIGGMSTAHLHHPDIQTLIDVVHVSGRYITHQLSYLDASLDYVSRERAMLGAVQNRLEYTIRSLDISAENLSDAQSRIRDADMAKAMMDFQKMNVLFQTGTLMLAQANQVANTVLELLR